MLPAKWIWKTRKVDKTKERYENENKSRFEEEKNNLNKRQNDEKRRQNELKTVRQKTRKTKPKWHTKNEDDNTNRMKYK